MKKLFYLNGFAFYSLALKNRGLGLPLEMAYFALLVISNFDQFGFLLFLFFLVFTYVWKAVVGDVNFPVKWLNS